MPTAMSSSAASTGAGNWAKLNTAHLPNGMCDIRIRVNGTTGVLYMASVSDTTTNVTYTPTLGTDPYVEFPLGTVTNFRANPQFLRFKTSGDCGMNIVASW